MTCISELDGKGGSESMSNSNGKILIEHELQNLPIETLAAYAQQVSSALAEHPDTMCQYTQEQILTIVKEGRAIIVVDAKKDRCNAFAQLHIWYEGGKPGAIEMRSWLSWSNGNGRLAVQGTINLSSRMFPNVPLFAIVATHNDYAKGRLLKYGGQISPRPKCIGYDLKDGETPVPTQAILLSNIQ